MKRRFLLPYRTDKEAEAFVVDSDVGFVQFKQKFGLPTIRDGLATLLSETDQESSPLAEDYAIPSILSYANYLESNLISKLGKGEQPNQEAVAAWRGILGVIGLSQYYRLDLTLQFQELTNPRRERGGIGNILCGVLEEEELLYSREGKKLLGVFLLNQRPIAFLHPRLIVCPFKQILPEVMQTVPWYDCHTEKWLDIGEYLSEVKSEAGICCEREALADWLIRSGREAAPIHWALKAFVDDLGGAPADGKVYEKASVFDPLPEGRFLFEERAFCSLPVLTGGLPGNLFQDRLTLLAAPGALVKLGNSSFALSFQDDASNCFNALLPLTEEMTAALTGNQELRLERTAISAEGFPNENSLVTVTFQLRYQAFRFIRRKSYPFTMCDFSKETPVVLLWPYVIFETGNPSYRWNDYYVAELEYNQSEANVGNLSSLPKEIEHNALHVLLKSREQKTEIESRHTDADRWRLYELEDFPEFIHFTYEGSHSCGCVHIKPNIENKTPEHPVRGGIDFGTTNTVSLIMADEKVIDTVVPEKYLCAVTPHDVEASDGIRGSMSTIAGFCNTYFIPLEGHSGKMASIAQIYKNVRPEPTPYEDGCAMFLSSSVISDIVKPSQKEKDGNSAAVHSTFTDFGIYNNMKLTDDRTKRPMVTKAGQIYIKNLLLYLLFIAYANNAESVEVLISYPREDVFRNIHGYWNTAVRFVEERKLFPKDKISYCYLPEATAASLFFQKESHVVPAVGAGYAIIDIGGGTTDISVWKAGKNNQVALQGEISIRYAGQELMVRSIYQEYPRGSEEFKSLWREGKKADIYVGEYQKQCNAIKPENYEQGYSSLVILIELLLEQVQLNEAKINEFSHYNFPHLRAVVELKVLFLFNLIGKYLLSLSVISPEMGPFNLYLAGSGSKIFKLFEDAEGESGESEFTAPLERQLGLPKGEKAIRLVEPRTADKVEVARGLLHADSEACRPHQDKVMEVEREDAAELLGPEEATQAAMDTYDHLIQECIEAVKGCANSKGMLEVLDCMNRNSDKKENAKRAKEKYKSLWDSVYRTAMEELKNSRMPPDLILDLFATLMADKMLNELCYQKA